jgi:DNA uptake protein ComE-like DNA-binding protein
MSAKTLEDCHDYHQALPLYRQALLLLPGNGRLVERIQKLEALTLAGEGTGHSQNAQLAVAAVAAASLGAGDAAVSEEDRYKALLQEQMANLVERQLVDILNSGDCGQLMSLHGVGKTRAKQIANGLAEHGAYKQLRDLDRIGLSAKQISKLLAQNAAGQLGIAGVHTGRR